MADKALMVAGFLADTSLVDTRSIIDTPQTLERVGYYDGIVDSYFQDPIQFVDSRETRMTIIGKAFTGIMSFHFDKKAAEGFGNELLTKFLSESTETVANNWLTCFFNIVETAYLTQNTTEEDLNTRFQQSSYSGYVYGSLVLSADKVSVPMDVLNPSLGKPNTAADIRTYIQFQMRLGNEYDPITFQIYLSNKAFQLNYPMNHLMMVVLPCASKSILDFKAENAPDAMVTATNYLSSQIGDTLVNDVRTPQLQRQTGIYKFTTKYIPLSQQGAVYDIPFLIPYHGKAPSLAQVKTAVRDKLREVTNVTLDTLAQVFPELFADGKIFIVPFWGNQAIAGLSKYPSGTLDIEYAQAIGQYVFPKLEADIDNEWIYKYSQIIRAATSSMLMLTLASKENLDDQREISAILPTYVPAKEQDPEYASMDVQAQQFSSYLIDAIARLDAGEVTSNLTEVGGFMFFTFTVGNVVYYVMSKDSYPNNIGK